MSTTLISATASPCVLDSARGRAWQREIDTYLQNYRLLELTLAGAMGLPAHLTQQYLTLQTQMRTVLETLLAEVECRPPSFGAGGQTRCFYQHHTRQLRQLNRQVGQLLSITYTA